MHPWRDGRRSGSPPALNRLLAAKSQASIQWFAEFGGVQFQGFDSHLARPGQQFHQQLSGITTPAVVGMGEDHADKSQPVLVGQKRGGCDNGSVSFHAETTARRELEKKLP